MNAADFLRDAVLELKDIDEALLVPGLALADVELDSLDYVEIQVGIKKNFGVTVDADLFVSGKIKTLGDLCQYIEDHAGEAGAVSAAVAVAGAAAPQ
ncbi:MAG: acyl carrier protein [Pseudomonadota bacterium]